MTASIGVGCSQATSTSARPATAAPCAGTADLNRRAVVVGIDKYSADGLTSERRGPDRKWRDLSGAVNDARAMYEMLTCTFGFAPENVTLLVDEDATREAILDAIREDLVEPASKDLHLVFFYAGHGSQRVNSKSRDETDGKDDTLVPVDSRLGADDIRDKELRRLFNQALEKGARLTVVLDSCHSGGGVRGPNGLVPRAVELDLRDVADGEPAGPPLEQRGALVLAAAREHQLAYETVDEEGNAPHGAFTLALLKTLRTLPPGAGEPASETVARTRARLRVLEPRQEPTFSALDDVQSAPIFGPRTDQRKGRIVVAVESVDGDGRVVLQGGWVNGLARGSRLLSVGKPEVALEVTEIDGLTRSLAKVLEPEEGASARAVKPAQLFEVSGWASPPGPALPVRLPVANDDVRRHARALIAHLEEAGVALSHDPTVDPFPTHVLRWRDDAWRLTGPDGEPVCLGKKPAKEDLLARLRGGPPAWLFVELPSPPELVRRLEIGPGTSRDKVEPAAPDQLPHRYVLTGRWTAGRLELAWVMPGVTEDVRDRSLLPLRSRWHALDPSDPEQVVEVLRDLESDVSGLVRVHSWLHLDSQGWGTFPYELSLKPEDGGPPVLSHSEVVDGERYGLMLRADEDEVKSSVDPYYVYVFSVDSFGKCTLLFPMPGQGNVGNRFPATDPPYPTEITLGRDPLFAVSDPYGMDTYYLLATVEAVPEPEVLKCRGVRDVRGSPPTELEQLLVRTGSTRRGLETLYPESWLVKRLFIRAVPRREP